MPTIEQIFAKDLKEGDVLAGAIEVYTGAPSGPFVEHERVVKIEQEFLRDRALGLVRDHRPSETSPEEVLFHIHPDAQGFDSETLARTAEFIGGIERWVPSAKPEHEIPQLRVTTRRFGEGPPEREVEEDGSQIGSERELVLRWGTVVTVIRGDLAELHQRERIQAKGE